MKNWINDHLPWILAICFSAGSLFYMVQTANARITKMEEMVENHSKVLNELPIKIEYISQQLSDIKVDIKEIKRQLNNSVAINDSK